MDTRRRDIEHTGGRRDAEDAEGRRGAEDTEERHWVEAKRSCGRWRDTLTRSTEERHGKEDTPGTEEGHRGQALRRGIGEWHW